MGSVVCRLSLETTGPGVAAPHEVHRAHAKVWKLIARRLTRDLRLDERLAIAAVSLQHKNSALAFVWEGTGSLDRSLRHWIMLAAAIEAPGIARVLAPLGLRWRGGRTVFELLERPSAGVGCGLCRFVRADPIRRGGLAPDALDALRGLSDAAVRASPVAAAEVLQRLLAAPDRDAAVSAAGALARLLSKARAADRATLAGLVPFAWRHPDPLVARAALRCARSLGPAPAPGTLDAWVDAVGRFSQDVGALRELGALCKVAARSSALAAALPAWLRSPLAGARSLACARLREVLGPRPERWSEGARAAFDAFVAAAAEGFEPEHAGLLLRHFDRLPPGLGAALAAWLATVDVDPFDAAEDLFAQQRRRPGLTAACVRALLHPTPGRRSYTRAQTHWRGLPDAALAGHVALVLAAVAQTGDGSVAADLLGHLDEVLLVCLASDLPSGRGLATALLAPGVGAERVATLAEKLTRAWSSGVRDARTAVVREFVARGSAGALVTAFRALVAEPAADGGRVYAHVGQGLSWTLQRCGAWAEGGDVAGAAALVAPENARPNLLYNQACGYAMCGEGEAAAGVLAEAVALDPKQADDARADGDFAPVRRHPAMVALLGPL